MKKSTKNGYMMIYTRKSVFEGFEKETKIDPPNELQRQIDNENQSFQKLIENYEKTLKEKKEKWDNEKKFVEEFLSSSYSPQDSLEYYWVNTEWLKKYLSGEEEHQIENKPLLCEHKKMDPYKIHNAKRISSKSFEMIEKRFGCDVLIPSTDFCVDCCLVIIQNKQENKKEDEEVSIVRNYLKLNSLPNSKDPNEISFYYVNNDFLSHFKNNIRSKDKDLDVNASLICPHKTLTCDTSLFTRVHPHVWSYLVSCYPSSTVFNSINTMCVNCQHDKEKQNQEKNLLKEQRSKERVFLLFFLPFFCIFILIILYQRDFCDLYSFGVDKIQYPWNLPQGKYCLLSREWIRKWKEYVDYSDIETIPKFDCRDFICQHNKLKYNVYPLYLNKEATPNQNSNKFPYAFLSKHVYDQLYSKHGEKSFFLNEILIEVKQPSQNNKGFKTQSKGVNVVPKQHADIHIHFERCEDCITDREFNDHISSSKFSDREIVIQKRGKFGNSSYYNTRSKTSFKIKVSSDDPVSLLKMKIFEFSELSPDSQLLTFQDIVLEDEKSLFDYDVQPNSTIYLNQIESSFVPNSSSDNNSSSDTSSSSSKRVNNEYNEEGFKGSFLSSQVEEIVDVIDDFDPSIYQQIEQMEKDDPNIWACPKCTFHNPVANTSCEMCGNTQVKKKKIL